MRANLPLFTSDGPARRVLFSMLNPSTADAIKDDPTVRRCRGFAERETSGHDDGSGSALIVEPYRYRLLRGDLFAVVNPYAYQATEPLELALAQRDGADIVGPENDAWIAREAARAHLIIVASGNPPAGLKGFSDRMREVARILSADGARELLCFGLTKAGWPKHPLYLASHTPLVRWEWR